MKPAVKMGRLANGNEADSGAVIHAVPNVYQYGHNIALCGAQPGRRSGGWDCDHYTGKPLTCRRCAKLADARWSDTYQRQRETLPVAQAIEAAAKELNITAAQADSLWKGNGL